MLTLNKAALENKQAFLDAGVELLNYDFEQMSKATRENPTWIHIGAGNIFRGFVAMLQQDLLNAGKVNTGIVAVAPYDHEIIDTIFAPNDNIGLLAIMNKDGSLDKKIIGAIGDSLVGDAARPADWAKLQTYFSNPSLQMVSFTITEKGYKLKNIDGEYSPEVAADMVNGPETPKNAMSKMASLLYTRFINGARPVAMVSMDNCSHNGDVLKRAIVTVAEKWLEQDLVEPAFLAYLNNPEKVSFPWSMIDKITPRPSEIVQKALKESGFTDIKITKTRKNTFIAPFVNAEKPQYLVIEDTFPNGHMPLEDAGVYFTDRQTVDRVEKMKVCTCLNPLHTALAVFGCLFGYNLIADEMNDTELKKLVEKIGYEEGMPVVVNPGIIKPEDFIAEVIEVRLPNPYIPDTPQRIATDTSQKVGIRFGETIKAYANRQDLDAASLIYIPLALAGWCRYLLGVDDKGQQMPLSPDPLLDSLKAEISQVKLGHPDSAKDALKQILNKADLFGVNLYEVGLGEKIEVFFTEMIAGPGAVRAVLTKLLK
jgi:fructuronate reductase